MTTPLTNTQIPDKSIMDIWGRQTYLGNTFVLPQNGHALADTSEHPIAYISNPSGSGKALFITARKGGSADTDSILVRYYLNPTVSAPGGTTTPINLRPGCAQTSISQCYISPTVALAAVAQVRRIVFSHVGSYYDVDGAGKAVQIYDAPSVGYYFWGSCSNGTHVTVDPGLSGTGVNVVLLTGDTAAQVATKFYTAIAAVVSHFTATNTPAGTVTPTNATAGATSPQDSVSGAAATLTVTTAGADLGAGTFMSNLNVTKSTIIDSDLLILDPGQTMLTTAQANSGTPTIFVEHTWYEI